jgi:hypothetical protein
MSGCHWNVVWDVEFSAWPEKLVLILLLICVWKSICWLRLFIFFPSVLVDSWCSTGKFLGRGACAWPRFFFDILVQTCSYLLPLPPFSCTCFLLWKTPSTCINGVCGVVSETHILLRLFCLLICFPAPASQSPTIFCEKRTLQDVM